MAQLYFVLIAANFRPAKFPLLQSFRAHPQPTAIPKHQLSRFALSIAEQKHMPAQRLALQAVAHQTKQSVESLAHVRGTHRQIIRVAAPSHKHGLRLFQHCQQALQRRRIKPSETSTRRPCGRTTANLPTCRRSRQFHRHKPAAARHLCPGMHFARSPSMACDLFPAPAAASSARNPASPTATSCFWQNSRRRNPLDSKASTSCLQPLHGSAAAGLSQACVFSLIPPLHHACFASARCVPLTHTDNSASTGSVQTLTTSRWMGRVPIWNQRRCRLSSVGWRELARFCCDWRKRTVSSRWMPCKSFASRLHHLHQSLAARRVDRFLLSHARALTNFTARSLNTSATTC